MVAQPARVQRRRHEVVPQRVHGKERRHARGVAEVVAIHPACERRAGRGLRGEEPGGGVPAQPAADEREREAGEVRPPAHAPDHDIRLLARHRHLGERLLPDHGLVHAHVVEHRAERVVGVGIAGRHLHRLRDRDPERSGRVLGVRPPGLGRVARRAVHGGAPRLHHRAPVRLLVVARADHVHDAVEVEQAAGERQGRAPLAIARLGRKPLQAGLLVLVRLRHRAVRLVGTSRRAALVLVVDVGRRIELALEAAGAEQRRRSPAPVHVAHLVRDLDLRIGGDLLLDQAHREDRGEVVGPRRLLGCRVERRARVARKVGHQVDPVRRDLGLGQRVLDGLVAQRGSSLRGAPIIRHRARRRCPNRLPP